MSGSFDGWFLKNPLYTPEYDHYLDLSPIRFWPLDEPVGSSTVKEWITGETGMAANITFGIAGPDGRTAARFRSSEPWSYIDVFTSALSAAFPYYEGAVACKARAGSTGFWIDGADNYLITFSAGGIDNYIVIDKYIDNGLYGLYTPGGALDWSVWADPSFLGTDWFSVVFNWSASQEMMELFVNGVSAGAAASSALPWSASLDKALIGSWFKGFATWPDSDIGRVALFDHVLSPSEIAQWGAHL
jgi:hypothetical protein